MLTRGGARLATVTVGLALALLGAQHVRAANPTLYVHYATNCTFTIVGDNGAQVSSIPPGSYQILVTSPEPFAAPDLSGATDPNLDCGGALSFRLTGPGVSLHTTLEDGDGTSDQLSATFQVGTYVAHEDRRPTVARIVLTVSGTAASTGGGATTGGSSSGGSGTSGTSGSKKAPAASLAVRGTLAGSVSTAGKLTLTFKGKAVSSLKAGRYRISVLDETGRSGFTIARIGKLAKEVTSRPFLGRGAVTLSLTPGQWLYYSPAGKKTYFVVVS